MLYPLIRQVLFRLEPEKAHHLALQTLERLYRLGLSQILFPAPQYHPRQVMGLDFPNPVGLAAGLDKNGDYIEALAALGFGFIEIGTVTPRPQPGNPQPRLFRLPAAQAIINRMGFNNKGVDYLVQQVRHSRYTGILGINIGKNFDTALERAAEDYQICLRKVYAHASYVTVNISSPNTANLRDLQRAGEIDRLLTTLKEEQARLQHEHRRYVPLVVKIAPDMSDQDLEAVAHAILNSQIDGVIATNTTLSRHGVEQMTYGNEAGGLSGAPLTALATSTVRKLHAHLAGKAPIIAAGGIMSGADAMEKFTAGACLVQIYTGFIYHGPTLIREILAAIQQSARPT